MFERFDEQARLAVMVLATDEARSLGHATLGSGHLLLGVVQAEPRVADLLGDADELRTRLVELVGYGEAAVTGQIRFGEDTKQAILLAADATAGEVTPREVAAALLDLPSDAIALAMLRANGVDPAAAHVQVLELAGPIEAGDAGGLTPAAIRVLDTAARHADDVPVGPEHLVLALVLEAPDLMARTIGIADAGVIELRLARLLDGPERPRPAAGGRDIAILESALAHAAAGGRAQVTPDDLLLGLLDVAPDVVARAAVDLAAVEAAIRSWQVADDHARHPLHRFSAAAREAVMRAADEARRLDHAYVGTEHLLLGLLQDAQGVAGRALADLRVGLGESRIQVERIVGRGPGPAPAHAQLPFTARTQRVLRLAEQESFRSSELDTGHLLLAIERDGDGVAMLVLERLGVSRGRLRRAVAGLLGHEPVRGPAPDDPPATRGAFLLAEREAAQLGQAWVGCEHLLLSLVRRPGPVRDALAQLGVTLDGVLWAVIDLGADDLSAPFRTARLVRAVGTAGRLAEEAGRPQVVSADLLLGLVRESIGAARAMLGEAADEARVRHALGER